MDISKKARDEFMKSTCVEMMKEHIRHWPSEPSKNLAQRAVDDASALWDALIEDLLNDID